jgi:putative transport protein
MFDWFSDLIRPSATPTALQSLLLVFATMAIGIVIGKVKIRKISLGVAGVMFAGIVLGHMGYTLEHETLHVLREIGLLLFVYAVGIQVGPSFFSSFKKDGVLFNALSVGTVLLGGLTTYVLFVITPTGIDHLVGIMSGAVTNTPGLGAAKAALAEIAKKDPSFQYSDPANGYALAYPFGVLGVILVMLVAKSVFKISVKDEVSKFDADVQEKYPSPATKKCRITEPEAIGKTIEELVAKVGKQRVLVSRLKHSGSTIVTAPAMETILQERDVVLLVGLPDAIDELISLMGRESSDTFIESSDDITTKTFLITRNHAIQKSLAQLDFNTRYGVRVTRVFRSGMELLARPSLVLHYGDRIRVVGTEQALKGVERVVGNSEKRLQEPQMLSIFIGLLLGILAGSIPFAIPGLSAPVKLGIAGTLLTAILISRFGGMGTIHSFLNHSAILFMKEFGISLFFATVGIYAGQHFVENFLENNGWWWVIYGAAITLIPLIILTIVGRWIFKLNFLQLIGIMGGAYTDPAALAFSGAYFKTDIPAQAYATVFPLTTITRILLAQILVLLLAG